VTTSPWRSRASSTAQCDDWLTSCRDTPVLPTHGFGSFCSATPTDGSASTVSEQVKRNPVSTQSEDEFVRSLLAGLDPYPAYYAHMAPLNLAGPAPVDLSPVREADLAEVLRRIERGEWVVDLRDRQAFARGHVPSTLSFEAGDSLAIYLGWLIHGGFRSP
jgi:hydroxyacylglutathione hydrolase